jgi:hypothetical protein
MRVITLAGCPRRGVPGRGSPLRVSLTDPVIWRRGPEEISFRAVRARRGGPGAAGMCRPGPGQLRSRGRARLSGAGPPRGGRIRVGRPCAAAGPDLRASRLPGAAAGPAARVPGPSRAAACPVWLSAAVAVIDGDIAVNSHNFSFLFGPWRVRAKMSVPLATMFHTGHRPGPRPIHRTGGDT